MRHESIRAGVTTIAATAFGKDEPIVFIPSRGRSAEDLQEVKTRLPERGISLDVESLTELLRETEEHHGKYEPTAPKHHWSSWYAAYMVARLRGRTPEEAAEEGKLRIFKVRALRKQVGTH